MKFALFFLAEYINMFTVAALATTLFLGGWQRPVALQRSTTGCSTPAGGRSLWFLAKVWMFMFVFVWLRGSLPRMRYDQFMKLRLEVPHPGQLGLGRRSWRVRPRRPERLARRHRRLAGRPSRHLAVPAGHRGARAGASAGCGTAGPRPRTPRRTRTVPEEIDPYAGGYPVPPLPGQRLRDAARSTHRP